MKLASLSISEALLITLSIIYLSLFMMNHNWIPLILLIYTVTVAIYIYHIKENLSEAEMLSPSILIAIFGYYSLGMNPLFLFSLIVILAWLYSSNRRTEEMYEWMEEEEWETS